jgi:hypothetical protein
MCLTDIQKKVMHDIGNHRILFKLYEISKTRTWILTIPEKQLFDAIREGNVVKANEILQMLLKLDFTLLLSEYESMYVKKIYDALDESIDLAIKIFLEWFILTESLPYLRGTSFTDILSHGKYDKAIIKLLEEDNFAALDLLEELGFDIFYPIQHKNRRFMHAFEVVIENRPEIDVFKKINKYKNFHNKITKYEHKVKYYGLVIYGLEKAYKEKNFDEFEKLLDEFKNLGGCLNSEYRLLPLLEDALEDATKNNDMEMLKYLVRNGICVSYINPRQMYASNSNFEQIQLSNNILKELYFDERKSLLMISESFSQYNKSNENPHILKYMFNKMIVMEVSSFILPLTHHDIF